MLKEHNSLSQWVSFYPVQKTRLPKFGFFFVQSSSMPLGFVSSLSHCDVPTKLSEVFLISQMCIMHYTNFKMLDLIINIITT